MGEAVLGSIAGSVASGLVGKALGGGSTKTSYTPNEYQKITGVEFQPFTYTGAGGFGVTGSQAGDNQYNWSANVPTWLSDLGASAGAVAPSLFNQYYQTAAQDPYAAAQEYYQRGIAQLQPELAKQQIAAQERMFGTGRLGLKLAGEAVGAPTGTGMINPDAYGLAAGQAKALQDLYTQSLTSGQSLQTNRLNQLSQAAGAAKNLGLLPSQTEQDLINFAKNLEIARSNAMKSGTQTISPVTSETNRSIFAGQIAPSIGQGVSGLFSGDGGYFSGAGGGFMGSQAEFDMFDMMPFDSAGSGGFFSSFNPFR